MPEFEEGGVERYVLQLCHEQLEQGHEIALATAGGKLEKFLNNKIKIIKLPVQRKNLFTGFYSAFKLAKLNKFYNWDIIHAHSRVPAFIAWITASLTKTKWIMTAHAPYSLNLGIIPLKHSNGVICVSQAVYNHLQNYLPANSITIANGAREPKYKWQGDINNNKFLFVGYLAKRKGLDTAIKALGELKNYDWTLDILGDDSQRQELEELVNNLNLNSRVKFYGFRDDAEKFMSVASCLLFPSHQEGLPLTVNEALSVGLPIIASDIEPLRPLLRDENLNNLVAPGDINAWRTAIQNFLEFKTSSNLDANKLTSFKDTAREINKFYLNI